jgi:hypothetical protein
LAPSGNPGTAPAGCAWANTCGTALAAAAAALFARMVRRLESIIGGSLVVHAVRATGAQHLGHRNSFKDILSATTDQAVGRGNRGRRR